MPPSTTSKRALTTARIASLRGRPPGLGGGSKSLIRSHSASVRSVGYGLAFIPTVYRTDATYGRLFKQPLRKANGATHEPLHPSPEIDVLALDFLRILLAHVVLLGIDMPFVGAPAVRVKLRDAKGLQELL